MIKRFMRRPSPCDVDFTSASIHSGVRVCVSYQCPVWLQKQKLQGLGEHINIYLFIFNEMILAMLKLPLNSAGKDMSSAKGHFGAAKDWNSG